MRLRLRDGDNYMTGEVELFILIKRHALAAVKADLGFAAPLSSRWILNNNDNSFIIYRKTHTNFLSLYGKEYRQCSMYVLHVGKIHSYTLYALTLFLVFEVLSNCALI